MSPGRSRAVGALAVAALGAALGVSTLRAKEPPASPSRGGRLVTSLRSEPKHFNPLAAMDRPTQQVVGLLMADLVHIDRQSYETYPNAAESWSVSEDGKTYTVELREGLRFSDGHPADADDVVFSFEAYLSEENRSPQRDLLVVAGQPIRVEKIDERRVRFQLEKPYAAGERLFDSFYILPSHRFDGPKQTTGTQLVDPADIVGLGPFRLKRHAPGERVVLERNPHYWKKDRSGVALPYLDEIVLEILPSEEAELLRLRAGELHLVEDLSPSSFASLQANAPPTVLGRDLGPGLEYNLLFFNLNDPGTSGPGPPAAKRQWFAAHGFRRAVSAAVDRSAIVRLVYGGRAAPLATHVTPGNRLWFDPEVRAPEYSLAAARRELFAAGFRWNDRDHLLDPSGRRVEISILTSASNNERKRMAAILQEDLTKLGMRVTVTALEFRAFLDSVFSKRDFDLSLLGLAGGDADPNPDMSVLVSSGSTRVWRLHPSSPGAPWEAEIDRLMAAQMTELDPERRREIYGDVQRLVAEHLPFIGIASPHVLVAAVRSLGNFRPGLLRPYTLWNAEELYLEASRTRE